MVGITTFAAFACILSRSSLPAVCAIAVAIKSWDDRMVPAASQVPAEARRICFLLLCSRLVWATCRPAHRRQPVRLGSGSFGGICGRVGLVCCHTTDAGQFALPNARLPISGIRRSRNLWQPYAILASR